ncbi:MAG: hypothetical protein GOP50_04445 [Candidatus Heimdallarchaeota archaeon]|nr:hypothetical protein [Candidatus Heimdallarchaeota archaeon]
MVEDTTILYVEETKKDKNYTEIVIRSFKPALFGTLSCVSLILALLEIVDGIFYVVFLTFLLLTIITIVTGQQSTKKIKLN